MGAADAMGVSLNPASGDGRLLGGHRPKALSVVTQYHPQGYLHNLEKVVSTK